MAKKKASKPVTKGNLIATFLFYNPDIPWTEAKPVFKKMFEGREWAFDEAEAKRIFDTQKSAIEAHRAMQKVVEELKPLLPQFEAILAKAKAAKKKKT